MADPQMHWWDWRTWLYLACGVIGIIIGGLIAIVSLIIYVPIWLILKFISFLEYIFANNDEL